MEDFIGQEVDVGDIVAMSTGKSAYLQFGRVIRITPKGCTVEYGSVITFGKKKGELNTKSCHPHQVVKIQPKDAIMAVLKGHLSI